MSEKLLEVHPSMFRSSPFGFILSLLLIPVFGLGAIILMVWYIQCKMSKLVVYSDRVLKEYGLLSKSYDELSFKSIRSVNIKQSLLQRMLSAGDVEIYSAGDKPEIVISGIPHPLEVREMLREKTAA